MKRLLIYTFFTVLTIWLGYFAERSGFAPLLLGFGLFFGGYWLFVARRIFNSPLAGNGEFEIRRTVWLGIFLRIILLFSVPNLSDDFYRFVWDGKLTLEGIHPFAQTPTQLLENQTFANAETTALFEKLNSKNYFTVYPPVCQAVFSGACFFSGGDVFWAVVFMKTFLLLCEIGTIFLLQKSGSKMAALYAMNPLAIIEICGNLHFEGAMIFFLLAAVHFFQKNKTCESAIFLAFSVASKLLPLLFIPLILSHLGWKRGSKFLLVFSGACLLLFLPMLDFQVLRNMAESLDLYFQKFEFNASLFYVFREIGYLIFGWNMVNWIGPGLAVLVFAGVVRMAWLRRPTLPNALLLASALHLICSTTVHPWYVLVPFSLSLFTDLKFPTAWTGLAFLSYSHYAGGVFLENYWLIGLEYGLLLAFWWLADQDSGRTFD